MMGNDTRSEDTILFFAINREITPLDTMINLIDEYIQRKQTQDPTDRFNFIAFEANGPIFYEDFLFDRSYIVNALRDIQKTLSVPNLAGGIFLGLTQIIDVFKQVGGKCFRMIVLMDSGTRLIKSTELLQSILTQVRNFPVFIDFVRINTEEIPKEDVELVKFASQNNGTVYFAKHSVDIPKIFNDLLKKKSCFSASNNQEIPPENEGFYSNLGANLWVVEDSEPDHSQPEISQSEARLKCQICRNAEGVRVMCPNCRAVTHPECLALWAKMSNIGLPYLFRCSSCYLLLQLPAEFVKEVQSGKYKNKIVVKTADQTTLLRDREKSKVPALGQSVDILANKPSMNPDEEEQAMDSEYAFEKDDKNLQIQFCECGALNLPEIIFCSHCGRKLR